MAGEIIRGGDIAPGQGTADRADAAAKAEAAEVDAPEDEVDPNEELEYVSVVRDADVLLSFTVRMMEKLDTGDGPTSSMSLTINVPGGVISGQLIARHRWVEQIQAAMMAADAQTGKAFGEAFEELKPPADAKPNFLHLQNAHYVSGGSASAGDGFLWRGRISDVSGWSFTQAVPQ
ncbi:hypothetical protein [Aeromicrobium sp. Root472D3]|uniref:hypothetical protein n=1 Tax=Aeromicrobium sp. Root472D3 TaxID=1736540 RepID=UPI0006FEF622|nr:hypothetical protein [Aeromicrobium sp. Root472D3]KQX76051.1 hypothetical protein ASD10_13230 [Aeromicrobium sp. Root472D3]